MTYIPSAQIASLTANQLTVGEEIYPREGATSLGVGPSGSGQLRLCYFTCRKTETTSQVRVSSGTNGTGGTATLTRIGMYLIDSSGGGTLVAATDGADTTIFTTGSGTAYTRSWLTPYRKIAGQRYAVGPLVVTAGTIPNILGYVIGSAADATSQTPTLSASINSLSDLPASFVVGSLSTSGHRYYAAILP